MNGSLKVSDVDELFVSKSRSMEMLGFEWVMPSLDDIFCHVEGNKCFVKQNPPSSFTPSCCTPPLCLFYVKKNVKGELFFFCG